MTAFKLGPFGGIAPRTAPELLPDNGAQTAANCRVNTGDLSPLREGLSRQVMTGVSTPTSIFRIDETGSNDVWISWTADVDCVRGPIADTATVGQRYYYTGDGVPKATTYALAIASTPYPGTYRALGVPKPITKPTVGVTAGGTGAAEYRYYCYTFYDDWDQESAPSPLSDMITGLTDTPSWNISVMDVAPPNSAAITNITYVGTTVTITTGSTHYNRVGDVIVVAGVAAADMASANGTWTLTAVTSTTMTFVVATAPTGAYNAGAELADTWTRKAPWGTTFTKRLYRTAGTLAQFQLCAEGILGSATTYADTLLASSPLFPGDELISGSWELPPADLKGLCLHSSGALIGFSLTEKAVCMSEPYQPHAWPPEYRIRTDYPPVGVKTYAGKIVCGTEAIPYLILGETPGQMSRESYPEAAPCLAKRSMAALTDGAVYATSDGLVKLGDSGVENLTLPAFIKEQWRDMNPSTMQVIYANGIIYVAYIKTGEPQRLLIISDALTEAEIDADGLYVNPFDGRPYYVKNGTVYEHDADDSRLALAVWKSKEFVLPAAQTLTAARVEFVSEIDQAILDALQTAYNAALAANEAIVDGVNNGPQTVQAGGSLGGGAFGLLPVAGSEINNLIDPGNTSATVTFTLYADGEVKFVKTVSDDSIFRLPTGYSSRQVAIQLATSTRVKSVEVATNPLELGRV